MVQSISVDELWTGGSEGGRPFSGKLLMALELGGTAAALPM